MRNLFLVCAGLLVISGIVSANLWRELRTERTHSADLQTQLAEATRRARVPVSMPTITSSAPPIASTTATGTAEAKPAPAMPLPAMPMSTSQALQNELNQQKELWKDPEYRKAQRARIRVNLQRQYAGLAEELGLTDAEADRVLDALTDYQVSLNSELTILSLNAQNDPAAQQDMARKQMEMSRQRDDALNSLLGSRYGQYQQFQQTLSARSRVTSMNNTLAQVGQPLNAAQIKSLTATLHAEQQRQQQDMQALTRNINPQDPQARARVTEEMRKRSEETNRRMLDAAAPTLTPQQLATLRSDVETQDAVNRASSRVRERMQAQQSAP